MKRTPIISIGQVYLHPGMNEYLVVTKSTQGDIQFKGIGFAGHHEVSLFLERFGPVDPVDLDDQERSDLGAFLKEGTTLLVGWVCREGDEDEYFEDEELQAA